MLTAIVRTFNPDKKFNTNDLRKYIADTKRSVVEKQ